MRRVVLVSNRVLSLSKATQAGGVAVALADLLRSRQGIWFGWNGRMVESGEGEMPVEVESAGPSGPSGRSQLATVPLTAEEHRDFYLGYSNSVLWPVFHNRVDLAQFEAGFYRRYLEVNARFARSLKPLLKPGDLIWVHDYQLIPMAEQLRKLGVTQPIGFFLHIPVPPSEALLTIPEYREVVKALAAYDLIGVQTTADIANLIGAFEDSAYGRILPDGRIRVLDREVSVGRFPVSIHVSEFSDASFVRDLAQGDPTTARIIGVDRLDYTKGLPQKFRAYGRFLEKYPQYRRKVVLSQIAPLTRESVEAYSDIRQELERLSGSINGMFGELDWVPIHYIRRPTPRKRLRDIYRSSRIGLVTPLRDGMNLVAKEYVAAQDPNDPGVVILSRFAGAAEQMKDALIVNPYNVDEMADAIKAALEMSLQERRERHAKLLATVRDYDTFTWGRSFLDALEQVAAREARLSEMPMGGSIAAALERFKKVSTPGHGGGWA